MGATNPFMQKKYINCCFKRFVDSEKKEAEKKIRKQVASVLKYVTILRKTTDKVFFQNLVPRYVLLPFW